MNRDVNSTNSVEPIQVVDLAKTQVLNLNELEDVANYEVKTSKRPVIMLALAGVFSIMMGLLYPKIMGAIDGSGSNDDTATETVVFKYILSCDLESSNSNDGINLNSSIDFNFENSSLVSYTKKVSVVPIAGNTVGVSNVSLYYNTFKSLEKSNVDGYKISTDGSESSFNSVIEVDFNKLDKKNLSSSYSSNYITSVNYDKGQLVDDVKKQVELSGYKCK